MSRCIAFVAVLAVVVAVCSAQDGTAARKCYVCSNCPTTDGVTPTECAKADDFCYKETRPDGTVTRSCAQKCEGGNWRVNDVDGNLACCGDKDACNSATAVSMSTLGLVGSLFLALNRL